AGANNLYGHPHTDVVSRVQVAEISLYDTDVHGIILVTTNGNEYNVVTQEDGTISHESTGSAICEEEEEQAEMDTQITNSCVDINQASIDEVQHIIHIGPDRAQILIDLRPFNTVDDLSRIKGIGPARIADIKSEGLACVN